MELSHVRLGRVRRRGQLLLLLEGHPERVRADLTDLQPCLQLVLLPHHPLQKHLRKSLLKTDLLLSCETNPLVPVLHEDP